MMTDTHCQLSDHRVRGPLGSAVHAVLGRSFPIPVADSAPPALREIVEREVVPHLHKALPSLPVLAAAATEIVLANEVADFADLLLIDDRSAVYRKIETLCDSGYTLEGIFLQLLAPAASYLRDLWLNDLCGFAEVTLAVVTLQSVVRRFAPAFRAETLPLQPLAQQSDRRAMIVAPRTSLDVGTTMFGLILLAEFFRRVGWEPWVESDPSGPAVRAAVRDQWFDVAEVLIHDDGNLDAIAAGIKTIRSGSLNRSIGIILCGQASLEHPEYARLVGADLTSPDPRAAVIRAQQFVSLVTPLTRLR